MNSEEPLQRVTEPGDRRVVVWGLSYIGQCGSEVQKYRARTGTEAALCAALAWCGMNGERFLCSSVLLQAKKRLNLNKSCICKVSGWHG